MCNSVYSKPVIEWVCQILSFCSVCVMQSYVNKFLMLILLRESLGVLLSNQVGKAPVPLSPPPPLFHGPGWPILTTATKASNPILSSYSTLKTVTNTVVAQTNVSVKATFQAYITAGVPALSDTTVSSNTLKAVTNNAITTTSASLKTAASSSTKAILPSVSFATNKVSATSSISQAPPTVIPALNNRLDIVPVSKGDSSRMSNTLKISTSAGIVLSLGTSLVYAIFACRRRCIRSGKVGNMKYI